MRKMLYRARMAWKVLRGEYVAQPRLQIPTVWAGPCNGTSAGDVVVTWTTTPTREAVQQQREAIARAVGRRAVMRHRNALRRLAR